MIISDLNYIQTVDAKEIEGGAASFASSSQIIVFGGGGTYAKTGAKETWFYSSTYAKTGAYGYGALVAQSSSAGSYA